MEIRTVDEVVKDDRGSLIQVISSGEWKQLNILIRKAGSLGGGHYHRKIHEYFYVVKGRVQVKTISVDNGQRESHIFQAGDCFAVLPGEQHYMKFLKETILAALYSIAVDKEKPDTFVDRRFPSLDEVFLVG